MATLLIAPCISAMYDSIELPAEYSEFELEKLHTQVDQNRKRHILEKPPTNAKKPIQKKQHWITVDCKSAWVAPEKIKRVVLG